MVDYKVKLKLDVIVILFFWRFYLFLESMEGREKDSQRNISVWLPLTCPPLGTWAATQACALTRNQMGNHLVHKPALNPLSYTGQSYFNQLSFAWH